MQFLIDEDVHIKVLDWLTQNGHSSKRTPSGLKNGQVLELASRESRTLITRDRDFSNRVLYPPSRYSGIVVLRVHPPTLDRLTSALQNLFPKLPPNLSGKLIIAREHDCQILS